MAAGAPFDENETRNPMAEDSFTLFSFVDEVESRVEMLRKQATALIGERASLLMIMDQLKSDCMRCDITSGKTNSKVPDTHTKFRGSVLNNTCIVCS